MSTQEIKKKYPKEILQAKDLKGLDLVWKKYLGRKGEINKILKNLKKLSGKERINLGKEVNQLKKEIAEKIEKKKRILEKKIFKVAVKKEQVDVTAPGKKFPQGYLHPLTQIIREVEEIFQSLGFLVAEGPEIETEYYNFDALNVPENHPARDLWDTFWLRGSQKIPNSKFKTRLLLRTHTTSVDIRYMEKNNPPLRIIVPGRIFRHEATDASHDIQFYQLDGLMVDKDISVANFKAIIEIFFQKFFKRPIKMRLRPSFFPFTEPSFEVDIDCLVCQGKGCSICSGTGWIEVIGAGMVHPAIFRAAGLNPKNWQGFAFGMGIDRLAMMKYKINDIRLFYGGDLRFLNQF